MSEVAQAGLQALDRDEALRDDALRRNVREALSDGRAGIPADEVFAALRAHHADRVKPAERDV